MQSSDPYTIRIFVADGDPEGVRIVDRANWTGLGFVIPRERWMSARTRGEFDRPGVYILSAHETDEIGEERLAIYIGQTEQLRGRLDSHDDRKEFWERATVFLSNNGSLNRAHITWLEWALIQRAKETGRAHLTNGATPNEPTLSEWEKADTNGFLKEVLRVLPLVGLTAFEPKLVVKPSKAAPPPPTRNEPEPVDTIVVPARKDGFERAFIGEGAWWAIRISQAALHKLKWIATYQVSPISAITHIAEIDRIEPYGDAGKYKVIFKAAAKSLPHPIAFGGAASGSMQGPRYTSHRRLMSAATIKDVFG